ncbi:hypothetical protein ASE07_13820 [Noviherbaspirillum sp. Root189]|nr:hypothetical protein ASE07_13820 [Noviherbaspirillum sp. Root189]
MEQAYVLPGPVGRLLSLLPSYPGSVLFTIGLNIGLTRHLPGDLCEALQGKTLRIGVIDAGANFAFRWNNGHFSACAPTPEVDLTISANAHDFLLLARRQVDPDTLFFSRRLLITGDTELGLRVKNALDGLDLTAPEFLRLAPRHMLSLLKNRGGFTEGQP